MIDRFFILAVSISIILISVPGQISSAQESESGGDPVPLVLVNDDTLTTYDLLLELDIMDKMNPQRKKTIFSEPEKVLRRLIQNQLILQEGYRMEMDEYFAVSNQVKELVRHKGTIVLLDSVALSVTADSTILLEARQKAVQDYIKSLMEANQVSIDSTLLKSLDYASSDPEVQKYLQEGTEVLAVVPTGTLNVARFSRILRFREFHGLVGKHDAVQRRDKIINEWISEAILSHQVKIQEIDRIPSIQRAARDLEQLLIRQETLAVLLQSSYEPTDHEIKKYYDENKNAFMLPTRVKMKSKKLNTEAAAQAFKEKLIKGADINWLAEKDPEVVPGADPFPYDWFPPEKLGLKPDLVKTGYIPDPYGVPGGWVVAVVSEVEEPEPIPLNDCRAKIISKLKSDHKQKTMTDIMRRLEEASTIEIQPGAENVVQEILEEVN